MTTKESVANMALQTGERIKTSAMGFFRGLETTLQNREQIEVAIAKMFGACTGDLVSPHSSGGEAREDDEEDVDEETHTPGMRQMSLTDSRESLGLPPQQAAEERLGAAPLQREASRSTASRKKTSPKASPTSRRKSSGSASSDNSQVDVAAAEQPRRQTTRGTTDYGEHIYAQLFMDDQKRAAQAVTALRQTQGSRKAPGPPSPNRPFPASSPAVGVHTTPLKSNDLHILALSFDDGISAISNHTLEAMADRQDVTQVRSTDSSLWSSLKNSNSFLLPPVSPPSNPRALSPMGPRAFVGMPRVRSQQSHKSRTSATTKSSGDTSFQHMWQQEEERFWGHQVDLDSSRKSRKSGASVRVHCSLRGGRCLYGFGVCLTHTHSFWNYSSMFASTGPKDDCQYALHLTRVGLDGCLGVAPTGAPP
jgi:hypothetical protein